MDFPPGRGLRDPSGENNINNQFIMPEIIYKTKSFTLTLFYFLLIGGLIIYLLVFIRTGIIFSFKLMTIITTVLLWGFVFLKYFDKQLFIYKNKLQIKNSKIRFGVKSREFFNEKIIEVVIYGRGSKVTLPNLTIRYKNNENKDNLYSSYFSLWDEKTMKEVIEMLNLNNVKARIEL